MPIQTDAKIDISDFIQNKKVIKVFSNIFYVSIIILIIIYIIVSLVNDEPIELCRDNIRAGLYIFISLIVILSINNSVVYKLVKRTNNLASDSLFNQIINLDSNENYKVIKVSEPKKEE